jgi:cytochrome c556
MTFMKTAPAALALTAALVAGIAFAKEGVKDPVVKARQDLMVVQAMSAKTLGEMAGGKIAFDAAAAEAAKSALAAAAADVPAKFEAQATDPVSEAKPEIWANWDDFVSKSEALVAAAEALDLTSAETIGAGMGAIGGACKACHTAYRM